MKLYELFGSTQIIGINKSSEIKLLGNVGRRDERTLLGMI